MSIDEVVDLLAAAIDRPLVLYDADFNVVAYSAHAGEVDQARRTTILTRHGTSRAQEMMRLHRAATKVGPLRLPADGATPARIVYPVRHEGAMVGYLVYVEPGAGEISPRTRDELEREAAELGRLLLVRDLDRQASQVRLRTLISDLVSDDTIRRSGAAQALVAEELLPVVASYTGVVLVAADATVATSRHRTVLEAALRSFSRSVRHPVVGAVTEGAAIAIVAGRGEVSPPRQSGSRREGADFRMGVGSPVPELVEVSASVRQARIGARACLLDPARYPAVARWGEMGIDRILLQLPLEQLTTDDLPPSVARLLDPSAGPDLASTIEAYLDCAGDAQATALRLTIHRSTFYYRLDRAREVTGADLHDGEARRELHTGLRIARLAGLGTGGSAGPGGSAGR